MANGKFIVCNPPTPGVPYDGGIGSCADCGAAIGIEGARDASAAYICTDCLTPRLERDEPDEVEVTHGGEAPSQTGPQDTLEAARNCRESTDPACGCAWCQVVNPIAADMAGALSKHKGSSKLAKVEAIIRLLGEAAVVYKGQHSFWHRDAVWTAGLVATRLTAVADREAATFYERMRPLVEEALAKAGVDLSELVRDVPKEPTH